MHHQRLHTCMHAPTPTTTHPSLSCLSLRSRSDGSFAGISEKKNSHKSYNYENWAGGQPDDYSVEDCVIMYASGEWNDITCDSRYRFVARTLDSVVYFVIHHLFQPPSKLVHKPVIHNPFPPYFQVHL